jgi:hypothetical protein
MGLLVLLVPTKYEVYRDLLSPPASKEGGGFSDLVERRLNAARVPVINLQPHFHSQAQALLPSYVYLYWLDDTHWTAEGIREAAEAIGESRAVLDCHCK